jgi:HD-like signal output (HDOD) protein
VSPATSSTLLRLVERILERHPSCGLAAELLGIDHDAPDAVTRLERVILPTEARFAARMRRLAASPFDQSFESIPHAAQQIGFAPVHASAVASTTFEALYGPSPHLNTVVFWRHATAVGVIAMIGASLERVHADQAFAGGFFATIGRLMADLFGSANFADALRLADAEGLDLPAAETLAFGFNESELGAALATRWRFPDWLVESIAYPVSENDSAGRSRELAGLVYRATIVARARGFGSEFEGVQLPAERIRWLVDPLLQALDRLGGAPWLEARVSGMLASGIADG